MALVLRAGVPGKYGAWNEVQGSEARRKWRDVYPDPLRPVRSYRNRLVHGRVVPEIYVPAQDPKGRRLGDMLFYPRLEKVETYLDWRVAFAVAENDEDALFRDFNEAALIVLDAWERVVRHVEEAWQKHLVA